MCVCVCKRERERERKRERVKEDEQLRVCVHDCMRDKVCKHAYVYVSIHAHKTAIV